MNNFEMWEMLEDHGIDIKIVFAEMLRTMPKSIMKDVVEIIVKNSCNFREDFVIEEESMQDYQVTFSLRGDYTT